MQDKNQQSALWQRAFFERNNFYFGKLMTARDFTDEQGYFNGKRWMLNRFGLGWGVLCGLKVHPHREHKNKVIVEPGFAIDPFGHEIMVCREETVDLTSAHDDCPPDKAADSMADKETKNSHLYYVYIKYEECGVNPSPIPLDSCDGYKEECAYNRIREGYRLLVSRKKPHLHHDHHSDCFWRLQDPSQHDSDCPERPECEPVPLASVCYNQTTDTTMMDIDMGMHNRKLAFSNEMLFEMLWCMQQEVWQGRASKYDRRQHVPLLASTIKGLEFHNGKTTRLDQKDGFTAKYPFRLTSDGDYIWVTDRDDKDVWRISRNKNKLQKPNLRLDDNAWGIAYDGKYMWITHHEAFQDHGDKQHGKLTRVNARTLKRHTFSRLPKCDELPDCYRFPEHEGAPGTRRIRPYPGEVVLHDGDIYVAHDLPKRTKEYEVKEDLEQRKPQAGGAEMGYELSLTRIDPVRGCIEEVIDIPEWDHRESWSRIRAMASDGDALWITYQASSKERRGGRAVVRKITKEHGKSVVSEAYKLNGEVPEHMVFDGTRLWVSHNDGVSIVNVETGEEEETINSRARHTALAYGGAELLWAALPGGSEASINWINIFSEEFGQWMELMEVDFETEATFEISDMQFDGTYLYIAYHLKQGQTKKGMIHRLLP